MNKAPAFQFYADDFLGGVADMTQAEIGAYIMLLCAQWNRGAIPTDPARAALIAKGEVTPHVLSKFPAGKNPRLEAVRAEQQAYRELQAEKGRASAQARFNRGSTAVQPRGQPKANPPSPSPSPLDEPKGSSIPPPPVGATGGDESAKPDRKPEAATRERNPLFDALAAATDGPPDKLTSPTARAVGVALAQIRKASPDVTPAEIDRRATNYRGHFRDATLTASALAKHWARCESGPSTGTRTAAESARVASLLGYQEGL